MTRVLYAATAVVVVVSPPMATSPSDGTALPARLESYLTNVVKPAPAERKKLLAGAPVTKLLDADASKAVAAFGAIWIKAPIRRYVEAVQDIENFERGGGFKVTKRISTPPRLEDFAQLHLPEDDVEDLRTCRVGSCELKLAEQSLERFRTEINWKAPNARSSADALMRRLTFEYVTGYLDGGNERLAVYRDSGRPTFVTTTSKRSSRRAVLPTAPSAPGRLDQTPVTASSARRGGRGSDFGPMSRVSGIETTTASGLSTRCSVKEYLSLTGNASIFTAGAFIQESGSARTIRFLAGWATYRF